MNAQTINENKLSKEHKAALGEIVDRLVMEYEHKQLRNKVTRNSLSKSPSSYQRRPAEIKKIPREELVKKMRAVVLNAFEHSRNLPALVERHGLEVVHLIAQHGAVAAVAIDRYGERAVQACKLNGAYGALSLIQQKRN